MEQKTSETPTARWPAHSLDKANNIAFRAQAAEADCKRNHGRMLKLANAFGCNPQWAKSNQAATYCWLNSTPQQRGCP